jgi:diguanylate cyclase (GGDEF)-like protein
MELREYIRIILKHVRLVVLFTLVSFTITMLVSYEQTPVFESVSTYVTRLETGGGFDAFVYGMDTLAGRTTIVNTYCDVMESGDVRLAAYEMLNLDPQAEFLKDFVVDCTVLPTSTVFTIKVEGTIPAVVQGLNQAVGLAGIERSNSLYPVFRVVPLDVVTFNPDPISPNYLFNGVLGASLGVLVSITVVLLLEYLRSPQEKLDALSIYDTRLNVYNNRYMQRRLQEEINRARMQNRLMALAMVTLVPDEDYMLLAEEDQELLLRAAATRLRDNLRETDIIAYRGDQTFLVLMPETSEQSALQVIRKLHDDMRGKPVASDRYISNFTAVTGLIENNGGILDAKESQNLTLEALRTALQTGSNTIEFIRTKPSPFTLDEAEMERFSFNLEQENPTATGTRGTTIGSAGQDAFSTADLRRLIEEDESLQAEMQSMYVTPAEQPISFEPAEIPAGDHIFSEPAFEQPVDYSEFGQVFNASGEEPTYAEYEQQPTYADYEQQPTYADYEQQPTYAEYEQQPTYAEYVEEPVAANPDAEAAADGEMLFTNPAPLPPAAPVVPQPLDELPPAAPVVSQPLDELPPAAPVVPQPLDELPPAAPTRAKNTERKSQDQIMRDRILKKLKDTQNYQDESDE